MNTKLIFFVAFICTAILASFSACTKDIGKQPAPPVVDTTKNTQQSGPCDTITYTKHIKPIVTKICLKCHGDVNPFAGFSLNSYDLLKAKGQTGALLARVVNGKPSFMPQGRAMATDTTAMFNCWINNGYKQ